MRAYQMIKDRVVSLSIEECFPFLAERGHVISLVGAGGKTTLMYCLAQRFAERGMKTVVMTTTKIKRPDQFAKTIEECEKRLAEMIAEKKAEIAAEKAKMKIA